MKTLMQTLLIGAVAVAGASSATAAEDDAHTVIPANEIDWASGPPSLPSGAEAAVLYGDPSQDELFALRLKLPEDYVIPPHHHPRPEVVTVISGTFHLGMGEEVDRDSAEALPAGSFFAISPGMAHYAFVDEETVVQLNSTGPWDLEYVNPEDDPRGATQ